MREGKNPAFIDIDIYPGDEEEEEEEEGKMD